MPAVRRIAERAEVGVVRRGDVQRAAWPQQAMKFLHAANDVGNVFDDVNGAQMIEAAVAKRIRKMVEIAEDIGGGSGDAVDSDRTREFVYPAADVEDPKSPSFTRIPRHSSSVSTAKSA